MCGGGGGGGGGEVKTQEGKEAPGGLAWELGRSGVVLRWGPGVGSCVLRERECGGTAGSREVEQHFGVAGRLGRDRGLRWDGGGCALTLPPPHPGPRSLQHPNVLQCLGVCVETLPFLLIMEFCQLVRVCGGRAGWRAGRVEGCQQAWGPGNLWQKHARRALTFPERSLWKSARSVGAVN